MRILQNAMIRLLRSQPFYAHFLLQFHREKVAGGLALGVTLRNGTPVLQVDPEVFAAFRADEQQALLEHVLKHVLHLHMIRGRQYNAHDWDIACDLAINSRIRNLPPQAARPEQWKLPPDLSAEEYYAANRWRFDTGNVDGEGVGNADRSWGQHVAPDAAAERDTLDESLYARAETLDDHQLWQEADSTPETLAEQVVRQMVEDAWRKSDGEVPGDVAALVRGFLAPSPIPWQETLRQFIATAGRIGRRSTWKRENRRFAHTTPGQRKRRRLNLLVAIDVSDSTNIRELREAFAHELLHIARGRDSQVTVLYAGSRIQRIDSFRSSDAVLEVYEGGGYTDLRPVFAYAAEMQPRPAAVIYLTDGFGEAPETMLFPTLWVLTADGEKPAPWGAELRLCL